MNIGEESIIISYWWQLQSQGNSRYYETHLDYHQNQKQEEKQEDQKKKKNIKM